MINSKRLIKMARKWQKIASIGRKRISMLRTDDKPAWKGCFVVYTADGNRFVLPLAYLKSPIFIELFRLSEDEFGLPGSSPITIPCDVVLMDYIISLVQRRVSYEIEKALVMSIVDHRCSSSSMLNQGLFSHDIPIHVF